jgi:hypothetical protein
MGLSTPLTALYAKKNKHSKLDRNLANPPNPKFHDRRLKKVYRVLRKQYKMLYAHAASDGYIFPNEQQDLMPQLRILYRVITIDKRNKKVKRIYRRLWLKKRRYKRKNRWRKRRGKTLLSLSADEQSLMKSAAEHKTRYEKMIRRFACLYVKRYARRHKKICKKRRTAND